MAGDVNLFFNDLDEPGLCEVEVMVAEERWRRKGLAREALLMLLRYGERDFWSRLLPTMSLVSSLCVFFYERFLPRGQLLQ